MPWNGGIGFAGRELSFLRAGTASGDALKRGLVFAGEARKSTIRTRLVEFTPFSDASAKEISWLDEWFRFVALVHSTARISCLRETYFPGRQLTIVDRRPAPISETSFLPLISTNAHV